MHIKSMKYYLEFSFKRRKIILKNQIQFCSHFYFYFLFFSTHTFFFIALFSLHKTLSYNTFLCNFIT